MFHYILGPDIFSSLMSFIFVFAILFGLLSYANIAGFSRKVNATIAAVFGVFSASFSPLVSALQAWLPLASLGLVAIFMLIFIKKLVSPKKDEHTDSLPAMVSAGLLLIILGTFSDQLANIIPLGISASNFLWIFGIILVLAIFWYAYKHKGQP